MNAQKIKKPHLMHQYWHRIWFFSGFIPIVGVFVSMHIFAINKDHSLHDVLIISVFIYSFFWFLVGAILDIKVTSKCPKCGCKTKRAKYIYGQSINKCMICERCLIEWDLGEIDD